MLEFNVTFDYDIDAGALREHNKLAPYVVLAERIRERNVTIIPERELEQNEYADLKAYIETFNNFSYTILTREKLELNTKRIAGLSYDFAVDNSKIMFDLGYTSAQKQVAVREVVDAFKEIEQELRMFSYYDVFTMLDSIVRSEPLLTEARLTQYKTTLAGILA